MCNCNSNLSQKTEITRKKKKIEKSPLEIFRTLNYFGKKIVNVPQEFNFCESRIQDPTLLILTT